MSGDLGGHTHFFSGTLKNALSWFCPFANTSIQQSPAHWWPGRHVMQDGPATDAPYED